MDNIINGHIIRIFPDAATLFQVAAEDFMLRANKALKQQEYFTVVLSGGETPKAFYEALVKKDRIASLSWQKIKFFFADERYVPAEDPANNYHLAQQYLFSQVPILPENIYRIPTDFNDPHIAAAQYENTLREVFKTERHQLPLFDLVYLGLGSNAHTASLMPDTEVVKAYLDAGNKPNALVAALWVPELKMYRITLTPPALNNSAGICFQVKGGDKALAVKEVLQGSLNPLHYPAQLIKCAQGETLWYLDQQAAEKLS